MKFVARSDALASQLGITRSTLSTKLFNDGKRIDQLASGLSDIGVQRLARAEADLEQARNAIESGEAA